MYRSGWLLLGTFAICCGAGCAGGPEEIPEEVGESAEIEGEVAEVEPEEEVLPAPRGLATEEAYLGDVNYVSGSEGFSLIQVVVSAEIPPGEKLLTRSADGRKTGEVILSPERKRWYLIGDVISGYPQVGDRVYYQRPATAGPATKEEDNDQRRGSKKANSGSRRLWGR